MDHLLLNKPPLVRLRSAAWTALIGASLMVGGSAQALISINFAFDNDAFFTDTVFGLDRRTALESSAVAFSAYFGTVFNTTGSVTLTAEGSYTTGSSLASAGSQLIPEGTAGFTLAEVVRTKLQTGVDLNGIDSPDGGVRVNFGKSWSFDAGAAGAGQFDFYGVMFHEFTHALGFFSTISEGGRPLTPENSWNTFDSFLADAAGTPVIDHGGTYGTNAAWLSASKGGTSPDSGLFFTGPNAVAANGGTAVGLYSPTTWQSGSSASHLDTNNPDYRSMMMVHAVGTGAAARNYSPVEIGIMQDLGYGLVVAVPEPATHGLMLAGLVLVGWMARHRRP